jgi:hypothetical protein
MFADAYYEGRDAFYEDLPRSDNPFEDGTPEQEQWFEGYDDAKFDYDRDCYDDYDDYDYDPCDCDECVAYREEEEY